MTQPAATDARLFEADTALTKKLGYQSFDRVVTPARIAAAEESIVAAADEIFAAIMGELDCLQAAADLLPRGGAVAKAFLDVIDAAFAIKSKAGLCGYAFGSELAKSLYLFCELDAVYGKPLSAWSRDIIRLHVAGLKTIFTKKLTGDGGVIGASILAELQKASQPD